MCLFPKRSRVSWLSVFFFFFLLFSYISYSLVHDSMSAIAFLESGCSIFSSMYILYSVSSYVFMAAMGICNGGNIGYSWIYKTYKELTPQQTLQWLNNTASSYL